MKRPTYDSDNMPSGIQIDSDYTDFLPSNYESEPERALLGAMLSTAIMDIGMDVAIPSSERLYVAAEAKRWVNSKSTDEFSFIWICETLGFDVDTIRSRILTKVCNTKRAKARIYKNKAIKR